MSLIQMSEGRCAFGSSMPLSAKVAQEEAEKGTFGKSAIPGGSA